MSHDAVIQAGRLVRRARPAGASKAASRSSILEAARRVAERDGARDLSLRAVAAEAGFAPAALYGYFQGKDELLLALAADDLTVLARAMREAGGLSAAAAVALTLLGSTETMAAASAALPRNGKEGPKNNNGKGAGRGGDAERLFNGRMIAALRALSQACGLPSDNRQSQCDVVLVAASLAGLALLERSGRLGALGFSPQEILARLDSRFAKPS
jgi:AcrR family transcriptional regulator